ncbi:MAG: isochorismatase family cysteine hydrolase [Sphingomicrobium sp.]
MEALGIDPARTALLNVDMQNCFVEGYPVSAPGGPVLLGRINELTEACRSAGVLVVHARHVLRPDGSNAGLLAEIPPVAAGMINKGSPSAEFHSSLVIDQADVVLEKPRFGAFHGTDLELLLRSKGIDTVIISGISTNVCCETTAREAAVRDFRVIFLSDGTATFGIGDLSAEQIQKAACTTIGFVFGRVASIDEVLAGLRETSSAQTAMPMTAS